jgi:PhnB protein
MKKKINPYLNFMGNTEEAFNFYKSVFGGEFFMTMRYNDTPESGKVAENEKNMIMHISLPIGGDGTILMGTDTLESMGHTLTPGNNFHLSIDADSKEEADKIYKALSAGGRQTMPMSETFWGAYFGMLIDKFDIRWMVSYDKNYQ